MKGNSPRELEEGQRFEAVLWLVSCSVRQTKTGDPYWEGVFQDAEGPLPAKLWDSAEGRKGRVKELSPLLKPGAPYRVKGRVDRFQGALQLTLTGAEAVPAEEADPSLFSPRSRRGDGEMAAEVDGILAAMKDGDYRRLLEAFRRSSHFAVFRSAPAAKSVHHAWVGGLLEHSLSLCRGVMALAPLYPGLDRDLLLCACFFHDAGKAEEISSRPGFEYTTDGKLLGHIYMGARLVEELARSLPGFPEQKLRHLVHIVLSHQGDRAEGFGSAADPQTPEAVFFHHLDNLDAKLQNCLSSLEKAGEAEGDFTSPRDNVLRKSYYRKRPQDPAEPPGRGGEGEEEKGRARRDDDPQPRLW